MEHEELTGQIIAGGIRVQGGLVPGYLESVYRNALELELIWLGLAVDCERKLEVRYREVTVGHFVADMVVEGRVLVEIKVAQALAPAHEMQLVNYLAATGIDVGLLLNFGAPRLEFKRKSRLYRPRRGRRGDPATDERE